MTQCFWSKELGKTSKGKPMRKMRETFIILSKYNRYNRVIQNGLISEPPSSKSDRWKLGNAPLRMTTPHFE